MALFPLFSIALNILVVKPSGPPAEGCIVWLVDSMWQGTVFRQHDAGIMTARIGT